MRLTSSLACVLALALCAIGVRAAEPRIGKFTRYDTGDFVIVTSRSGKQAREIMQKLVKFRITLEKVLGKRAAKSGIGTHIIVVSESDWVKYLQPRRQIAGFFQRSQFNNYMALNGDAGEYAIYVMFHEYTHFYLSSQFSGEYPPWFNEGLAELMAYAKFIDNRIVLQIPMFRVYEARDSDWITFDRLIKIDHSSPEYQSHKLADAFYAQSWLTVHYGMVEERSFARQIFNYLNQLNTLVPQEEAARKVFGEDLGAVDAKLKAYSRNTKMGSGALELGAVPEVELPKGEPMSEADSFAAIIDLMLATRAAPDRIRPLIEALQRREPNVARSYILAARLALFEDNPAAFEAAVTKAEGLFAPDDWQSRRDLASVLLASSRDMNPTSSRSDEDTKRDLKRSLKWYLEAVDKNKDDAEGLWGLGTALTRLNVDLELADVALQAAYSRVPASASIAVSLANLKGRQQEPDAMIPFLKDAIRLADDLSTRRWATETLDETQKYIAERNKVDEENRKQREDYEKKLAEYEKKYGKPKKKKSGSQ